MKLIICILIQVGVVLMSKKLEARDEEMKENGFVAFDHYFNNVINKFQNQVIARYSQSREGKKLLAKYFLVRFMRDINLLNMKAEKHRSGYMHWRHGRSVKI
jgi:hypothetical protein